MSDLDIKNIRKILNISQNILAKSLGVSIRTIQNWEAGEIIPKTKHEILRKLLEEPELKAKGIPLASVSAIGGTGNTNFAINLQDVKEYYTIPKFSTKKIDFMIEVEGSSMYPKYSSGDVVACTIIHQDSFIQWNKTHVIATRDQGIIIKRVKKGTAEDRLCMISDNKDYDSFEVPKNEINSIALVVGVIRLE